MAQSQTPMRSFGKRFPLYANSDVSLSIHPTALFLLPLLFISVRWRLLPFYDSGLSSAQSWVAALSITGGVLFSVLIHEIAHLVTAKRFGRYPRGLPLFFFGSEFEAGIDLNSKWKRVRVNLSGILATLFLAVLLFVLALLSETNARPLTSHVFFLTGVANIFLAIFQLLPALPLDGGRIILDLFRDESRLHPRAVQVLYYLGNALAVGFMGGGIYLAANEALSRGGYLIGSGMPVLGSWSFLVGLSLAVANFSEYQYLSARRRLSGKEVLLYASTAPVSVPPSLRLSKLYVEYLKKYPYKAFPVVHEGKLLGVITRRSLYRYSVLGWHRHTVQELLCPLDHKNTVSPNEDAGRAFALMAQAGNETLLISQNDRLVGIVTYADLLNVDELEGNLREGLFFKSGRKAV